MCLTQTEKSTAVLPATFLERLLESARPAALAYIRETLLPHQAEESAPFSSMNAHLASFWQSVFCTYGRIRITDKRTQCEVYAPFVSVLLLEHQLEAFTVWNTCEDY